MVSTKLNYTLQRNKIKLNQETSFSEDEFKETLKNYKAQLDYHTQAIKQQENMITNAQETIEIHKKNINIIKEKYKQTKEFAKKHMLLPKEEDKTKEL